MTAHTAHKPAASPCCPALAREDSDPQSQALIRWTRIETFTAGPAEFDHADR